MACSNWIGGYPNNTPIERDFIASNGPQGAPALSSFEEAFTSEHWIVRIYKVKSRPNLEATPSASVKKTNKVEKESPVSGNDARYEGGSSGANFNLAVYQ